MKPISNSEVIPEIDSHLFDDHKDARFAIGIVGVGSEVVSGFEAEYEGYTLLRGNVYGKQKNYMPLSELNPDGTETDPNDARSVHFAVIENALRSPRVVGSMRLIIKSREDSSLLPVEEHYPESFANGPAPLWSTECSRLIGRHEESRLQRQLKWHQFTAGVSYIQKHGLGPVFGVIEPILAKALSIEGFPARPIGEPKYVPEFNSKKQPIRVDMEKLAEQLENDEPVLFGVMNELQEDFVYLGKAPQAEVVKLHGTETSVIPDVA